MQQPYVSTLIEQDFTTAEKALGRHNIDAISSADLEGYATQEWVQDQNYITSADLPDVSDMATKTWTSDNFYPDTNPSGFITSSDVPRYREGDYISIDPISLAISVTGINPDDYLTSADMSQYATHEEVESATSGKMDSTEASAFYPRYDNPEGYITSADLPDLTDYVTSADVSGFVDVNYVENNFYSASNPSGFITSADLPDMSEYATIQYVDNSVYSATSGKQDSLVFGYTDNKISSINSSAIYSTGGSGSDIYRKPYGGSEIAVSALKIDSDDPDGYAYVTADEVGQGYLVSGPYKRLLDAGINSGHGVGDSATPIYIDNNGEFKTVSATFTQEQADWAESDNTQVDYIKNKPTPVSLEAISPLYITDETSASKIGIYSSAFPDMSDYATKEYVESATSGFPIMTGVGLKAGYGIRLTDETSAVKIESNLWAPTVECHAMSVSDSGYVNVIYPQSSACVELHVTTPKSYDGAEAYSARINDDYTYVIPSGCWYDFVKQDGGGGEMSWWLKDSGTFY